MILYLILEYISWLWGIENVDPTIKFMFMFFSVIETFFEVALILILVFSIVGTYIHNKQLGK